MDHWSWKQPGQCTGHEHPYSIKMSHVRDGLRERGSGEDITMPMDVDLNDNTVSVQFILRQTKKVARKSSFEDSTKRPKKSKRSSKSPLINFFSRRSRTNLDDTSNVPSGQLFGHCLSDVCYDEALCKPLLDLLQYLFQSGPYTSGVFRKPGNHKKVQEVRGRMDQGEEILWEEQPVLVACSIIKEFLRSLPDCLMLCDLYDQWVDFLNIQELNDRMIAVKRLLFKLPGAHSQLLRHLVCVLHHILLKPEENCMTPQALAVCISPSMLWQQTCVATGNALADTQQQAEEVEKARKLVQFMLENVVDLFGRECTMLFGAPPVSSVKTRQDSSTDSDSMHSMLSAPENAALGRHDNSSLDSLDRDLYYSEQPSPQPLAKAHLSPTNLSRDSGLTSSDPRLYDDLPEELMSNLPSSRTRKPSMTRSVSQQDSVKPQMADPGQLSRSYDCTLDTAHAHAHGHSDSLPVPPPRSKKGRRSSIGVEPEEEHHGRPPIRNSTSPQMKPQAMPTLRHSSSALSVSDYRKQMRNAKTSKRVSDDSLGGYLGSVEEDQDPQDLDNTVITRRDSARLQDLQSKSRSGADIGLLRKSASGTRIYVRDDSATIGEAEAAAARHRARQQQHRRSAPPQVAEVQLMLEQAKANVHQPRPDQSPSRQHQPQPSHNKSGASLHHSTTHNAADQAPPANKPIFRMSPHESPDESEESMFSNFTFMVPVTSSPNKSKPTPKEYSSSPVVVNTAAPATASDSSLRRQLPVTKRLLVKSSSLDTTTHSHPPAPMSHYATSQTPKTTPSISQETAAAQEAMARHPPHRNPQVQKTISEDVHRPRSKTLTRSNAVDDTHSSTPLTAYGRDTLHKKCMTSKGSDFFPGHVVKNLYRKSMDEVAILNSLEDSSNGFVVGEMQRGSSSPRDRPSRSLSSHRSQPRSTPRSNEPSPKVMPAVERLRYGAAMERSASEGSLNEQLAGEGHVNSEGQWQRPRNPPSYQEAMQRKANLQNAVPVSPQEIERQRHKNALAKKLYEESLKKHLDEESRRSGEGEQPQLRERSSSADSITSRRPPPSREIAPTQNTTPSSDVKGPPSYEHACQRAEQIREQKRERTPPKYTRREGSPSCNSPRSGSHQSTPSPARESSIVKRGSDHLKERLGGGSASNSREVTPTRSDSSSREGSMNRKQRRRSKDRRIGHRNSDSKLSSSSKGSRPNNTNLNRSKSDSSEHIHKISKYKDMTMGDNKENVSNEDLHIHQQTIEKLEKLQLTLGRNSTPERKQNLDKLEKMAKDMENEKMRRQKLNKSAENISYKLLAEKSQEPVSVAPDGKPHNPERRVSLTRSVKNRNWHKDLAEQYSGIFYQPDEEQEPVAKYGYSDSAKTEVTGPQEGEAPRRKWAPPVHPSKDLVITYARDTGSKPSAQVRRVQSHATDLQQHRRNTHEDKVKVPETRGRSNSDAPVPPSHIRQQSPAYAHSPRSVQTEDNRINSQVRSQSSEQVNVQQASTDSSSSSSEDQTQGISWSVSELRSLYGGGAKGPQAPSKDRNGGSVAKPAAVHNPTNPPHNARQQQQPQAVSRDSPRGRPQHSASPNVTTRAQDYSAYNAYSATFPRRQSPHEQNLRERTNPNAEEAYV